MADIPKLDRPIYAPLDLGTLDAQLQGVELRVLRNPTLRFHNGFLSVSMNPADDAWNDWVAAICGVETKDLKDTLGDLEMSIIRAMFVTEFDRFDPESKEFVGRQNAYILRVWDDYAAEKRKTYGGRS